MSVFGPIVHDGQIEDAVLDTLKTWLSSYLGELERLTDRDQGVLPDIKSWSVPQGELAKWPEDALPCVALVSPGSEGDARRDAEGFFSAPYTIEVGIFVSGSTEEATSDLKKVYAAAARACLAKQPPGAPVEKVTYRRVSYDDLPVGERRSMGLAVLFFTVDVTDIFSDQGPLRGEPQEEPRAPYPDRPVVADGGTEVTVGH